MRTHVALLRGINVGGRNAVPMTALREVAQSLGWSDAVTYIQSGNLLFTATGAGGGALADALEAAVAERFGVRSPVVVLTTAELRRVHAGNPFAEPESPKHLHAFFRRSPPSAAERAAMERAAKAAADDGRRDELVIRGAVVYLHTPDGLGRSRLAAALTRLPGTARNWATVTTLLELLRS